MGTISIGYRECHPVAFQPIDKVASFWIESNVHALLAFMLFFAVVWQASLITEDIHRPLPPVPVYIGCIQYR